MKNKIYKKIIFILGLIVIVVCVYLKTKEAVSHRVDSNTNTAGLFLINQKSKSSELPVRQLRVENSAKFPVDPLYIKTMAEYDVSLLLYRAWFPYDKGRRADRGGVIDSWHFNDKTGKYNFILSDMKWSDGSDLQAGQLIENLKRISSSKTLYGKSLRSIVEISSLKAVSPKELSFKTKNGKPSDTLFNQLGSVFFSIVHPDDLGQGTHRLISNKRSIGPYKISKLSGSEIKFSKNAFFVEFNKRSPDEILLRPASTSFTDFLGPRSWPNYFQANTLLSPKTAQMLIDSKLPIWSRGVDRVALLRPVGKGAHEVQARQLLQKIGARFSSSSKIDHPLQVSIARSLQPIGYPLYTEVDFPAVKPLKDEIKIITYPAPQLEVLRPLVDRLALESGLSVKWTLTPLDQFMSSDWDKCDADLVLFSFGVADPEPTTWLSLVFGSKFIKYTTEEKRRFDQLMKVKDPKKQIEGYRSLLGQIAHGGGYLPLLHAATIAIGKKGMNFDLVDPLDETIDFSKIIFQ